MSFWILAGASGASAQTPIPDGTPPDVPGLEAITVSGLDGDKIFGEDGLTIKFRDDFAGPGKVLVKSPLSTVWQDVTDKVTYGSETRTITLSQLNLFDFLTVSGANSIAELSIFQSQDQEEPDYRLTFSAGPTRTEICEKVGRTGLRKAFYDLLGAPQNCRVTKYKYAEFGTYQTTVLDWPGVELTTKFSPPETAVFVLKALPDSALEPGWFEANKDKIISDFFELDWETDHFPGPIGAYYQCKSPGDNAQLWLERDAAGFVTYMRFSYAL